MNSVSRDVLDGGIGAKLWLLSEVGEPTPERGGRAKRYFRITAWLSFSVPVQACLWADCIDDIATR